MQFLPQEEILQAEGIPKYKQIYEYFLNEISKEKFNPGDKIPSEKDICSFFGVSRITSKKALEMLASSHMISRKRGKGSFVSGVSAPVELQRKPSSFRTIAFLIPNLNDSFGKWLVYSVEAACEALGYHLILKLTHESPAEEEKALRILNKENVAGILMLPVRSEHYNTELLRQILNKRPLVFVDRRMKGLPVPSVVTDNAAASEMAVKRLFEQGHRNIAFYSFLVNTSTVEDRLQGFTKAFASEGISLNSNHICNNMSLSDGLDVVIRHLSEFPEISAAFTSEFEIAKLVKKALVALKRDTGDFLVVTFDHPGYMPESSGFIFLRQDEEAIGKQAMEILHRIINGESGQSINDILISAKLDNRIQ
jgi:DNA-binding LacI/PurR family transcriptional regulator